MSEVAQFKYTFPIAKAEKRADGLYLVGYASGPEIDSEGERMAPEAIERFAAQINETGSSLVYRDAHQPDGVLRDLGTITKAWVTEKFHLGVEVKLDERNPAATFLHENIMERGKQYGMSVAGHVVDYAREYVEEVGKSVLTYKNVVLDEISNTTRPAWYPSFGSVLAKSIKDAASETTEDTMRKTAENAELDAPVEDATKSEDAATTAEDTTEKADDAAATTDSTEKAAEGEAAEDTTEKADEADAEGVEKAGRRVSATTAATLLGAFGTIQTALTDIGVLAAPEAAADAAATSEKSADEADGDTTEKSDASTDAVGTELADLRKALEQATARISELEARPTAAAPGAITDTSKAASDEIADTLAKASPADRLRIAFALQTQGK